jgi:hypothetical protein
MRGFTDFSDAFDYCRITKDHPVNVVIGDIYKLYPSGRAELIQVSGEVTPQDPEWLSKFPEFQFPTNDDSPDEPEHVRESSQLALEEAVNLTHDEELRLSPRGDVQEWELWLTDEAVEA